MSADDCIFCNDWITFRYAKRMFARYQMTFFTGCGRSGTKWLANMLRSDDAMVVHEPFWRFDYQRAPRCRQGTRESFLFHRVRASIIYSGLTMRELSAGVRGSTYVEVNALLAHDPEQIRKTIPGAQVGLIVRDPLSTICSLEKRMLYREDDKGVRALEPLEDDPASPDWEELPRFGRLCWFWQNAVNSTLDVCDETFRLEELTSDYRAFIECAKFAGIAPNRDRWLRLRKRRINSSGGPPGPREITDEEAEMFGEICGRAVNRLNGSVVTCES